MMTNVLVRELDFSPIDNRLDGRRLEVVADGLEAFNGAQLAIDTTLACALRSDGTARPRDARVPWHCRQLEPAKSGPSQSWWVQGDGPDSWCSQRKSVDDG